MACSAPHAAEHRAHPGHGVSPRAGVGVLGCGGLADGQRQLGAPRVVVGDQRHGDRTAWLHGGIGHARGQPLPGRLGRELLAELGQVVWTLRVVPRGSAGGAWAPPRGAAAAEVTGGAPRRGRDRGLGAQATAAPDGHRVGLERIVCGVAAVAGPPREGLAQDTGEALWRPQVSQPIPGQPTLDRHDEALAVRGHGLEKGLRSGLQVAVQQDFSRVTHAAAVQAPSVQIKTTATSVWRGGAAPAVSAS
jgi:hypothetical protein